MAERYQKEDFCVSLFATSDHYYRPYLYIKRKYKFNSGLIKDDSESEVSI